MNEQTRRDARHLLAPVVLGVLLGGFAGCGGSGSVAATGGGVPGTGYAYVVSQEVPGELHPGAVYQFAIGADGSLAPLAAASVSTGTRPVSIASDSGGHYVYVVNGGDATISQYRVGSGGLLSPLVPGSISISAAILGATTFTGITVDPSGRLVYVVERALDPAPSAMIAQYSIGSDGALTPLTTPVQLVEAFAGPLVIHPNGEFAYLSGITAVPNTSVSQYSRDASGTLTPLVPPTPSGTTDAVGVYVVPSGQTVYVLRACIDVQCDGQIVQYTVGADGTLASTGNAAITGGHVNPVAMLTDESGSNAYLLANFMGVDTNQGTVIQYSINSQGVLAPGSPPSVPVTSGAVALASIGPHLYALSSHAIGQASGSPSGGNIDHFIVGSSGALNMAGTTALLGSFPVAMTVVSGH